ncbi:L,D-transpeptidase family protein [Sphingomonas hengshuiensis]|uniref:L,D-transpeptidase family protein n=1 Tax=Sphingomonas hengshuiensis TaxID=1609977 RepID=UPI000695AE2B
MHPGARAALAPILIALLSAGLAPATPVAAQVASDVMRPAIPKMRPGEFRWFDTPEYIGVSTGASGPVMIVVSIPEQRAYVYRDGRLIAVTTVSTGSRGHETPLGEFTILQKKPFHRSNLYSNAPMPYMQRLTWTGIAMHAGHLPGYPASHGCIRLPAKFARQLYEITALGGTVSVVDEVLGEPLPEMLPAPMPTPRPAPLLVAETRGLGGESYNVVTMRGDPPAAQLIPSPVSYSSAPREIVQPLARTRN